MSNKNTIISKGFRGQGFMTTCKFNHTGTKLYVSDKDSKMIQEINILKMTSEKQFLGHKGIIWSIDLSSDDKIMCSTSGDSTVCIWNTETGENLYQLSQSGIPKFVVFDNLRNFIVYNEPLGRMSKPKLLYYKINDKSDNELLVKNDELLVKSDEIELSEKVTALTWWKNNDFVYGSESGKLTILTLSNNNNENQKTNNNYNQTIQLHQDAIKSIEFNKTKTQILTSSLDCNALIINTTNFAIEKTFKSNSPVNYAVFLCNDKKIALGGGIDASLVALTKCDTNDLRLKVYNAKTQKICLQLKSHFGPIRYLASFGKLCVSASQDGTIRICLIDGVLNNDISKFKFEDNNVDSNFLESNSVNNNCLESNDVNNSVDNNCLKSNDVDNNCLKSNDVNNSVDNNCLESNDVDNNCLESNDVNNNFNKNCLESNDVNNNVNNNCSKSNNVNNCLEGNNDVNNNYESIPLTTHSIEVESSDETKKVIIEKKEPIAQKYIVGLSKKKTIVNDYVAPDNEIKILPKSLYVSNIPDDCSERELEEIFNVFGKLENRGIKIGNQVKTSRCGKNNIVIENYMYAFINYCDFESATKAFETLTKDRVTIGNNILSIEFANRKTFH